MLLLAEQYRVTLKTPHSLWHVLNTGNCETVFTQPHILTWFKQGLYAAAVKVIDPCLFIVANVSSGHMLRNHLRTEQVKAVSKTRQESCYIIQFARLSCHVKLRYSVCKTGIMFLPVHICDMLINISLGKKIHLCGFPFSSMPAWVICDLCHALRPSFAGGNM